MTTVRRRTAARPGRDRPTIRGLAARASSRSVRRTTRTYCGSRPGSATTSSGTSGTTSSPDDAGGRGRRGRAAGGDPRQAAVRLRPRASRPPAPGRPRRLPGLVTADGTAHRDAREREARAARAASRTSSATCRAWPGRSARHGGGEPALPWTAEAIVNRRAAPRPAVAAARADAEAKPARNTPGHLRQQVIAQIEALEAAVADLEDKADDQDGTAPCGDAGGRQGRRDGRRRGPAARQSARPSGPATAGRGQTPAATRPPGTPRSAHAYAQAAVRRPAGAGRLPGRC